MTYISSSEPERALASFTQALRLNEKISLMRIERTYAYLGFGYAFYYLGNHKIAAQSFQKVIGVLQEFASVEHISVGVAYNNLACSLFQLNHNSLAHDYLKISVAVLGLQLGILHEMTLTAKRNLDIVLGINFELPPLPKDSYMFYYENIFGKIGTGGSIEVKKSKNSSNK